MAEIIIDNYPIIVIKFFSDFGTDKEFDKYLSDLAKIFQYSDKNDIKLLFDASLCKSPSIKKIYKKAKFMRSSEKFIDKCIDRTAILVPDKDWIKYIKLIFKIKPPNRPYIITMSNNCASEFLNSLANSQINTESQIKIETNKL